MAFTLPPSLLDQSVLLDVIEHLPAGVFAKDESNDFRFVIWNREMEVIFATPREAMLGKNDYDFFAKEEADYYRQTDVNVMNGGVAIDIPHEAVTTLRGEIIAHTVKVPVVLNDGRRILLGILEDITESEENKRQLAVYQSHLEALVNERTHALQKLASSDTLTGLSNRAHFFEVLEKRMESGTSFSLIYLDLDRFKLVNDTHGHDVGDQVLQIIGERLRTLSPQLLNIARIGGDEFALLLDAHVQAGSVDQLCAELSHLLGQRIELDGRFFHIEGSMGICGFPDDARTPRQMLQHADMAMYHAKHRRSQPRWFRFFQDLRLQSEQEHQIEQGLLKSIENGELFLEYQPQYPADNPSQIVGLEALVRWRSPTLGVVPPSTFIPVAEMIGLVRQITDFVLETVCHDIRRLDQLNLSGGTPRISINISASELDQHSGQRFAESLQRHGIAPERITLEITENAPIGRKGALATFAALREQGLRISIDDFGTGYSSLAYIAELKIDEIKIDQSFIQSYPRSPKSESLIQAIVAIGRAFGYEIVAEGVEHAEQLEHLAQYDKLLIQGFFAARPAPLDSLFPDLKA